MVSGAGGQHDLVAMAHALDGARSIIAVRSTRRQQRRTISNIVWSYANATVPRHLRDIVVTEYGIADLRGKSDRDCIAAMLAIADGAVPGWLIGGGRAGWQARAGFRLARRRRARNRAEHWRPPGGRARAGLLPAFPLGTEMTEVEQSLVGPLDCLKNAGYSDLLRACYLSGWRASVDLSDRERAALERLLLDRPPACATSDSRPRARRPASERLTGGRSSGACCAHELPPRLSRRQLRGRAQARRARPRDRVPQAQGRAVPGHRHACRRRPLRARLAEAAKTGEWRRGIGRLLGPDAAAAAARRRSSTCNPTWRPCAPRTRAASSRSIPAARCSRCSLMRAGDALVANELHPEDRANLKAAIGRDRRAKVMALDGWVALKSLLPPKERRGVVLIDPAVRGAGRVRAAGRWPGAGPEAVCHRASSWPGIRSRTCKPIDRFHAELAALRRAQAACVSS